MTNTNRMDLRFGPAEGRKVVDRYIQALIDRSKDVSTSRPFLAFVLVAAAVIGLYCFFVAAPIYVSDTSFSMRGREQGAAASMGILAGLGQADSASKEAAELSQFILSEDMLNKLDARFHLRQLYAKPRLDLLNSMSASASKEAFHHFYKKMVSVRIDHDTNIITVEVRAFDRNSAHDIAEAILELAGGYVDGLSATVRNDTVKSSREELQKAKDSVRDSRLAMTQYRTSTGLLDPLVTAGATSGTINGLESQVLQTRAELASLLTYNTPNSPQVIQLRARISALEGQIGETQRKVADTSRSDNLAKQMYVYEGLVVANEYAEKQLVAALGAYDSALAVAGQRERFLVRTINPNLPDRPSQPKRLLMFLEALLVVVAAYGIVALAIAGIRDHQGI